jgi:hypothetical protein
MRLLLFITFLLFCTTTFSQTIKPDAKEILERMLIHSDREAMKDGTTKYFRYVYKNGSPYGKNAYLKVDKFYQNYKISFFRENGSQAKCTVTDKNFIYDNAWKFKYDGSVYLLVP